MFSIWWLFAALIGGVYLGILLVALMQMSADLPPQSRSRGVRKHGGSIRRVHSRAGALAT